jgi:hypothetical protein
VGAEEKGKGKEKEEKGRGRRERKRKGENYFKFTSIIRSVRYPERKAHKKTKTLKK